MSLEIVKGSCRRRRGIRHQKAFNKFRTTAIGIIWDRFGNPLTVDGSASHTGLFVAHGS